jgi:hypothetical protein
MERYNPAVSNGLDFTLGTAEGLPFRHSVSMLRSWASVNVASELGRGAYPILHALWDFRSTPVPHANLPALRGELVALIKTMLITHEDQVVIDELDDLLRFIAEIENLGLGVHVAGP